MNDLETWLTAALTDTAHRTVPDSLTPPVFQPSVGPASSSVRSRWLLPAAAAAVVVAVAVGALIGVQRLHHSGATQPSGTPTRVVFHTAGDVALTQDQLQSAVLSLTGRLAAAGIPAASVTSEGSDQLVVSGAFTEDQLRTLPTLMSAGVLEFRPLLVRPVEAPAGQASTTSPAKTVDPWQTLGFTPPSDAAGFDALGPTQRQAVLAVMNTWDCDNVSKVKGDAPILACDSANTARYLLGAPIFGAGQVKQAAASGPGTVPGQLQWTVNVELKPTGQQAWTDYTAEHNETVDPGAVSNEVADVLDGKVIVASTIESTITGTTQITGSFTEHSAKSLAAGLSSDPLPVAFVPQR